MEEKKLPQEKKVIQIGLGDPYKYGIEMAIKNGKSVGSPQIVDGENFRHPFSMSGLQYGGCGFEGMLVVLGADGCVLVYQPEKHWSRLMNTADGIGLYKVSYQDFFGGICELIQDSEKYHGEMYKSLVNGEFSYVYLRPFIANVTESLIPSVTNQCLFGIVAAPLNHGAGRTMRVLVEEVRSRVAPYGTGAYKACGNYAATKVCDQKAKDAGYDNVLWLDHSCGAIQEFSTMNIFAYTREGALFTPALSREMILDGITRYSVIEIAKHHVIVVCDIIEHMHIHQFLQMIKNGQIVEVFGTGTASMIIPCTEISFKGKSFFLPPVNENSMSSFLTAELGKAHRGEIFPEWTRIIPRYGDRGII